MIKSEPINGQPEGIEKSWKRAESMLPEDWRIVQVRRHFTDPNEGWWTAVAAWKDLDEEPGGGFSYRAFEEGSGRSPAEALDNLGAQLASR